MDQGQLINSAISGDVQATFWRNHPGGDPDGQYVWWKSDSPVNFGRIDDPEIDRLLDEGRSEPDTAKRKDIYEDITRRFADQVWNLWANWTRWVVGQADGVHGIDVETAPDLPDGSGPFPGLATGHPVHGIWIDE
jgi:peptide/nickel transport system substrate-binding protein